ncbi:MAG: hypothetical protein AB7S26_24390 [Sandaracinaceae bacterium]
MRTDPSSWALIALCVGAGCSQPMGGDPFELPPLTPGGKGDFSHRTELAVDHTAEDWTEWSRGEWDVTLAFGVPAVATFDVLQPNDPVNHDPIDVFVRAQLDAPGASVRAFLRDARTGDTFEEAVAAEGTQHFVLPAESDGRAQLVVFLLGADESAARIRIAQTVACTSRRERPDNDERPQAASEVSEFALSLCAYDGYEDRDLYVSEEAEPGRVVRVRAHFWQGPEIRAWDDTGTELAFRPVPESYVIETSFVASTDGRADIEIASGSSPRASYEVETCVEDPLEPAEDVPAELDAVRQYAGLVLCPSLELGLDVSRVDSDRYVVRVPAGQYLAVHVHDDLPVEDDPLFERHLQLSAEGSATQPELARDGAWLFEPEDEDRDVVLRVENMGFGPFEPLVYELETELL